MDVIVIMLLGVVVGNRLLTQKHKKFAEQMQLLCVITLIFSMGVTLGRTDGFLEDLTTLGFASVVYALVPIAFSTVIVYALTKRTFKDDDTEETP